jgi:carbon-monoxide dehydrogenase medium subunit
MKPAAFDYARPATIDEALALLGREGATALAGGQSLIPLLATRSTMPTLLVDIGRIAELRTIEPTPRGLRVGAAARLAEIAGQASAAGLSLLAEAIASVATPAIRNRATLVGNLVRASPNSELPVAVTALDARLILRGPEGVREITAETFFLGPHRTAIADGEIVTSVLFPMSHAARTGSAFVEVAASANAPPLACVAAHLECDADGLITQARLVVGGITGVPERCKEAEAALAGQPAGSAAGLLDAAAAGLAPSPVLPDAAYAAEILPVLLRRAIAAAASRPVASSRPDLPAKDPV